jgi:uncharacterized membrane protein
MQEWLAEKNESDSRWVKVGTIAAVSAAVFAFFGMGLSTSAAAARARRSVSRSATTQSDASPCDQEG